MQGSVDEVQESVGEVLGSSTPERGTVYASARKCMSKCGEEFTKVENVCG